MASNSARCTFCDLQENEVLVLVVAPNKQAAICDQCAAKVVKMVKNQTDSGAP